MTRPDMDDAFGHHVWATLMLLETCGALTPQQLDAATPGTYGSILDTLRHLVGADSWYLTVITHAAVPLIDEEAMSLEELADVMTRHGAAWSAVLREGTDPDTELTVELREGGVGHAPLGIRLAQALHHGTDHRSQVCTGLSILGIEPPEIDVWAFGQLDGRVFDVPPP